MHEIDLLSALAGLGLFLFGMSAIESGIKTVAGSQFKVWLKKGTDSTIKSIFSGTIVTAILQSSTLVSLMVLAFVGANLLSLKSAIGVIFGANIGSTGVSWIITLFGFKAGASGLAFPLMALSGLGVLFFGQKRRLNAFFSMLMGFGLLFYGLDLMKTSIESAVDLIDLESIKQLGFLAYIFVGFLLTLIIRSSAASMAIFLSALQAGAIDFYTASMLAIGANIGTTGTIVIGAIGGTVDKKRVAASHVLFNVLTAIIVLILYKPLTFLVLDLMDLNDNLTLALTVFYTIFSVLGVIVLSPFISQFEQFLIKNISSKEQKTTRFIDDIDPALSDAAVEALKNETINLFKEIMRFSLLVFNVPPKEIFKLNIKTKSVIYRSKGIINIDIQDAYIRLKRVESDMIIFASKIGERSKDDEIYYNKILLAIRELLYVAKIFKDIKHNIDDLSTKSDLYTENFYNESRIRVAKIFKYLFIAVSKNREFDQEEIQRKLGDVLDVIIDEDKNAIGNITRAIKNGDISQYDSPAYITINRSIVNASNSLIEVARLIN